MLLKIRPRLLAIQSISIANRTDWNDTALTQQYYMGLPDHLKDEIACLGKPAKLLVLQDLIAIFDQRYWECQSEISREKRLNLPSNNKSTSSDNRNNNWLNNSNLKNNNSNNQKSKNKDQKKQQSIANASGSGNKSTTNNIADLLGSDGKLKSLFSCGMNFNLLCLSLLVSCCRSIGLWICISWSCRTVSMLQMHDYGPSNWTLSQYHHTRFFGLYFHHCSHLPILHAQPQ